MPYCVVYYFGRLLTIKLGALVRGWVPWVAGVIWFTGFPVWGQQRPLKTDDAELVGTGRIRSELGVEFLQTVPQMLVIVMTGTILPAEEEAICEEHDFPLLRKPFLASDVMNQIRSRLLPVTGVVRA